MKNKKVKEFLVKKYTEKWLEENKEMVGDYQELCELIMLFHANWGVNIGFCFKESEEIKGRDLGKGFKLPQ